MGAKFESALHGAAGQVVMAVATLAAAAIGFTGLHQAGNANDAANGAAAATKLVQLQLSDLDRRMSSLPQATPITQTEIDALTSRMVEIEKRAADLAAARQDFAALESQVKQFERDVEKRLDSAAKKSVNPALGSEAAVVSEGLTWRYLGAKRTSGHLIVSVAVSSEEPARVRVLTPRQSQGRSQAILGDRSPLTNASIVYGSVENNYQIEFALAAGQQQKFDLDFEAAGTDTKVIAALSIAFERVDTKGEIATAEFSSLDK